VQVGDYVCQQRDVRARLLPRELRYGPDEQMAGFQVDQSGDDLMRVEGRVQGDLVFLVCLLLFSSRVETGLTRMAPSLNKAYVAWKLVSPNKTGCAGVCGCGLLFTYCREFNVVPE